MPATPACQHTVLDPHERLTSFGGLEVAWDRRVLEPRTWTTAQSAWAADLLDRAPDGPVLELFAGAGHIGQLAVRGTGRRLVCIDLDPVACDFAGRNAERNGLGDAVEVRCCSVQDAARPGEQFVLVVADPPWVPSAQTERFPEDPRLAIDGGADGLGPARAALGTAAGCLAAGGSVVLQLGNVAQVDALRAEAAEHGLDVDDVRTFERGTLVRLVRR